MRLPFFTWFSVSNYPMIIFFSVILFFVTNNSLLAQDKFSLTAGWGKYELANMGIQWNYSKKSSLSAYAGTNFGLNNNTSWAFGLTFDQVYLKPVNWKIKPGYSIGAILWTRDDELYYFKTLSLPIMALLSYPISPKLIARVESGIVISKVSESDRKQNVEAGFPKRTDVNLRLNIIYKLRKK